MTKTTAFDAGKYLNTPADHTELLRDALATGHSGYIAAALGVIAKSYGMAKLAKDTGLNRATLYSSLNEGGNPTIGTVMSIVGAVGIRIDAREADPK